jgi:CHASE2 domain-containing sensor protein
LVKAYRAATVVLLVLVSLLLLFVMIGSGLASMGWGGLVPLVVLIAIAGAVGVIVSWRRYFPRARRQ